jgi:hypothetical protein
MFEGKQFHGQKVKLLESHNASLFCPNGCLVPRPLRSLQTAICLLGDPLTRLNWTGPAPGKQIRQVIETKTK